MFFNLDQQVCESLAGSLAEEGWFAKVVTVTAAEKLENEPFNLYVFCMKTYNWAPHRPTARLIENHSAIKGSKVVAITLGSGSTARSCRLLEELIASKNADLFYSESIWLRKPNDDSRVKDSNVKMALEKVENMGKKNFRNFPDE